MTGFSYVVPFFLDVLVFMFFFFKQKTAYEMRISDWSSDVCSSDLLGRQGGLLNRLFSARSRALTGDLPEAEVRSYLSGLLIVDELATAGPETPTQIHLLGAPVLVALYEAALAKLGHRVVRLDGDAVAGGLFMLARHLEAERAA